MADALREKLWAERPPIGAEPRDAKQAAVYQLAHESGRGKHSQRCPVWEKRAQLVTCNCWILRDAIVTVESVVAAMDRHGTAADNQAEGLVRGGAVAAKLYVQAAMAEARAALKAALIALDEAERKYVRDLEGDAPYALLLATLTDDEKAAALKNAATTPQPPPAGQLLHKQRGACPACGKVVALRADGLIRNHDLPRDAQGQWAGRCRGSRTMPKKLPDAGRRA